ncbi:hypothetical protein DFH07DRAFT_43919 [Mycena maculata]|uniref:Uncharacterized protein n=1 Tax=Mycena maculata TaxID=230809 RepID=A0AAD7IIE8_9AGAR|nr:hypothetical protein DFH07DRAFT_43919 [Mycena maculata]
MELTENYLRGGLHAMEKYSSTSRRPASSCGIYWRSWREGTRTSSMSGSLFGRRGVRCRPGRSRQAGVLRAARGNDSPAYSLPARGGPIRHLSVLTALPTSSPFDPGYPPAVSSGRAHCHHAAPLVDPRALERRPALVHLLAELARGNEDFASASSRPFGPACQIDGYPRRAGRPARGRGVASLESPCSWPHARRRRLPESVGHLVEELAQANAAFE